MSTGTAKLRQSPAPTPRAYQLEQRFGLSIEKYNAMLRAQGGVCAICRQPERRVHPRTKTPHALSVDHNHRTGEIRGLLCHWCNAALGLVGDDASRMLELALYLDGHS
jgi:hypothetical protein